MILSLIGQPSFNLAQLPPGAQTWHSTLMANLADLSLCYPDPLAAAATADSYFIGRTVQMAVVALLAAFRATQDTVLLDKALEIMNACYATLADVDGDGRLEWYDLGPGSGVPAPTEDSMNTPMADTLAVRWLYVMSLNRGLKTTYETSYQQWLAYINETVLVDPLHGTWSKNLTHCWSFNLALLWYLYRLTSDTAYLNLLNTRAAALEAQMVQRATPYGYARIWDHRIITAGYSNEGCQLTDYAAYTVGNLADLSLDGYALFDAAYMDTLVNTARSLVFPDGLSAIKDDVCGETYPEGYPGPSGGATYAAERYGATWAWHALAAWDTSGAFDSLATAGLAVYAQPTITIPAYQLMAVIRRAILAPVATTVTAIGGGISPRIWGRRGARHRQQLEARRPKRPTRPTRQSRW